VLLDLAGVIGLAAQRGVEHPQHRGDEVAALDVLNLQARRLQQPSQLGLPEDALVGRVREVARVQAREEPLRVARRHAHAEPAACREHPRELAHDPHRVLDVLEHLGDQRGAEAAVRERQLLGSRVDQRPGFRREVARGLGERRPQPGARLDARDPVAGLDEPTRDVTLAATDVERLAAGLEPQALHVDVVDVAAHVFRRASASSSR
jgi:hypothetical protein